MSIRPAYPSIRPALLLDFANAQVLDPRVTFTRASTATYFDAEGVLRTAAAGTARFTFDPVTEESLGLLIEESRTNLILRSEDFSTTWSITGTASIATNTVVAPDGALTADKFVLGNTIASGNAAVHQSATKPATSAPYTASVFIKAGEFNSLRLILRDAANALNFAQAYFNAATGVIAQAANAGGTFTAASATITDVGNGWYRCTVTGTTSTETSLNVRIFNYQNGTGSATGDGTSGIYIWGAQLEAGAFATSYIPTVASQVTRDADSAGMTGTNFSSWFNQAEGSLYAETVSPNPVAGQTYWSFDVNTQTRMSMYTNSGPAGYWFVRDGGVSQAGVYTTGLSANAAYKMAAVYKANDFQAAASGLLGTADASGSVPIVGAGAVFIGSYSGGGYLNGTIKKLAYYPVRLPNDQLQALTR